MLRCCAESQEERGLASLLGHIASPTLSEQRTRTLSAVQPPATRAHRPRPGPRLWPLPTSAASSSATRSLAHPLDDSTPIRRSGTAPTWTASRLCRPTSTRPSRPPRASRSSSSTRTRCVAALSSLPPARPEDPADTAPHAPQTPIVSLATTQSHLLAHEVYLTDRVDNPSRHASTSASSSASTSGPGAYPPAAGAAQRGVERLPHLRCVCLVRPTDDSVEACARELREGRFGGYWLCASLELPSFCVWAHARDRRNGACAGTCR